MSPNCASPSLASKRTIAILLALLLSILAFACVVIAGAFAGAVTTAGAHAAKQAVHGRAITDHTLQLDLDTGETLTTTADHPIWSTTRQDWIRAEELTTGERLRGDDGQTHTLTASRPSEHREVYNLTIANTQTYHVGTSDLLVHNCPRPAATAGDDWPILSGIVRDAAKGKGNFGLGSGTASQAERAGQAWVGEGYTIASDGKTLVSANGLRQWRPPSYKPKLDKWQSNFESRLIPREQWQGNGHLDIMDLP